MADAETGRDRVVAAPVARDATARLRATGLAATGPRRRVLEALEGRSAPASAAEVYAVLHAAGGRIGLTTVYRVLHVLVDRGLVHVLPGVERRYRMCDEGPHAHLPCTSCGLVLEEPADLARRRLPARSDFEVNLERTPVYGMCGACRRASTRTRRGQANR